MKLQTIVKRYQKFGYIPSGQNRDIETLLIIKWIYETFDIYIDAVHMSLKIKGHEDMHLKFVHRVIYKASSPINNFGGEKYFKSPFDALFDGVCRAYNIVKNEVEREHFNNPAPKLSDNDKFLLINNC